MTEADRAATRAMERAEAALASADYETVAAVLNEDIVSIGARHMDRLAALAAALPPEALEAHPRLRLIGHAISNFLDQDQARAGIDVARELRAMTPPDSPVAERMVTGIGEIFALRAAGRLEDCVKIVDADRALVTQDREGWLEAPGQLRSIILLQWGISRMLVADLSGATADFQESYWAGRRTALPHFARNGAENAALMLALVDSVDDAKDWLAKARTIERAPAPMRSFVEEFDPLVDAALALARLDVESARARLAEFVPAPDTRLSWSFEAYLEARLRLLDGTRLVGLDELDRARHPRGGSAAPGSLDELLLASAEAELAIAAGRAPRAARVLDRVADDPLMTPARARHALMTGDAAGALAVSVAGLHETATFGRVDLAAIASVALAHLGRTADAVTQFGQALELARSRGVVAPFALLPRRDVEGLCALVPDAVKLLQPVLESGSSVERVDVVRLTSRERLVLAELARSRSVQQIADSLFVSMNTVKSQLRSVYRKLDVNSREEALAEALRLGFDLEPRS